MNASLCPRIRYVLTSKEPVQCCNYILDIKDNIIVEQDVLIANTYCQKQEKMNNDSTMRLK